MPLALQVRPQLSVHLEQYLEAFILLGHFRNDSGRISFRDIVKYADIICEDNVLEFTQIIAEADTALRKAQKEDRTITAGK